MTIADRAVLVTGPIQSMAESWRSGAVKAFERQMATFVPAEPVKS